MTDALHELRAGGTRELNQHGVALVAVGDARPDLDQLVVRERAVELRDQRGTHATPARQNDRLAIVSKSAEVFALRLGEHGDILYFDPSGFLKNLAGPK
jgi:hypothetical protein